MLTKKNRKKYLDALGYEYNAKGIKAFQTKYMYKGQADGIYGQNTDNALRTIYNMKVCTSLKAKDFQSDVKYFRCDCGGKYCSGYPTYMKQDVLKNLESIRGKYGAITVTSGLRCPTQNKLVGGISTSKHTKGKAVDFYGACTSTLAKRKKIINYSKTLKNHTYSYCNGWCSYDYKVSWASMGTSIHIDCR